MSFQRVVITGQGVVCPLGQDVSGMMQGLAQGSRASQRMEPGWNRLGPLRCQVIAPTALHDPKAIPRSLRRTMSRMSIFTVQAANQAIAQAGLEAVALANEPRVGCVMGSTTGSPDALAHTYEQLYAQHGDYNLLGAAEFFRCVSHTVAMNVAQYYGMTGVVTASSAACASGLQAVGTAYDQIRMGRQDVMLAGGGEEIHETSVGSFDILYAASSAFNETPSDTPRPFDARRDGLVCGEGAGVLVLESLEHAQARGATILAEILGYHTCGNGSHVSQSDERAMVTCMQTALATARMTPGQVGYISAHATGTPQGDAAEARAIATVFGEAVPVSSLKGNMGHTLGASGPIELIATLEMMRTGIVHPTVNLDVVADDCKGIGHVQRPLSHAFDHFLKNSFAFGGINSAIVCGRWH